MKEALLRAKLVGKNLDEIFDGKDQATEEYLLKEEGFSQQMVERFIFPFHQGIFPSDLQDQSSRMLQFLFQMFPRGAASLPCRGIGVAPAQVVASLLSSVTVSCNMPVIALQ